MNLCLNIHFIFCDGNFFLREKVARALTSKYSETLVITISKLLFIFLRCMSKRMRIRY